MSDYFWNPAASDGNLANANNWYPEPPVSGSNASFSNGDNWYFGALGADSSAISTGFDNVAGITLGSVIWYSTYQGNFGLGPQYPLEITALTNVTTTATATTAVNHGYAAGDTITVSGAAYSPYNGTFVILASGLTATQFTYTMGSAPGGAGGVCKVIRNAAPIIPCTAATIGKNILPSSAGTGAPRLVADFGASAAVVQVINTVSGTGADNGLEACRLNFNSASASLAIMGGSVGVCTTTPITAGVIGSLTCAGSTSVLDLGVDLTYTNLTVNGGSVNDYGNGPSRAATVWSGSLNLHNAAVFGTVTAYGGNVVASGRPASGNTINTLNLYGGIVDFSQDPAQFQLGAITLRDGQMFFAYYGQLTAVTSWTVDMLGKVNMTINRT